MLSRDRLTLLGLSLLCLLNIPLGLQVGAVAVSVEEVVNTLFDLPGPQQAYIILQARLPRVLLALLTGAALALSGTIIQTLLRNPLASPKIIGINSGAAAAVLLCMVWLPDLTMQWLPLAACMGGMIAGGLILLLAERHTLLPSRLILLGLAVGFVAEAVVDFLLVTLPIYSISAPLVWLTGSLWARNWQHVASAAPILLTLSTRGC